MKNYQLTYLTADGKLHLMPEGTKEVCTLLIRGLVKMNHVVEVVIEDIEGNYKVFKGKGSIDTKVTKSVEQSN